MSRLYQIYGLRAIQMYGSIYGSTMSRTAALTAAQRSLQTVWDLSGVPYYLRGHLLQAQYLRLLLLTFYIPQV